MEHLPVPQNNYERIRQEIDTGNIREDVWTEAYGKANGNYNKAVSIYITLRAEQLYKENTTFFRRTGHSVAKQLDFKQTRGKQIIAAIVIGVVAATFFGMQPLLRSRANANYIALHKKAKDLALVGKSRIFVMEQFGRPNAMTTTDGGLAYIYNPASRLCFARDQYQFKIVFNAQTATVSLWEWNAAFNVVDN